MYYKYSCAAYDCVCAPGTHMILYALLREVVHAQVTRIHQLINAIMD